MQHDPLSTLLERADAAANPAPAAPPDLATRVRQRAARQRQHRRAATALAATAAIVLAASIASRTPKPTQIANPAPVADVAQLQREYARLTADADLREQVLRRIAAYERAAAAAATTDPRVPPDPDPAAAIAAEVERSALILLRRGERLLDDPDAKAQAADAFRRIVAHFPDSRGAAAAREHLERIGA